jgi:hypothetical protein
MSNKKIFLNISEIASFIGKNPYDCVAPFERLWKKCDAEEYNKAMNEISKSLQDYQLSIDSIEVTKKNLLLQLESKQITKRQYTKTLKEVESKENETKDIIKDITEKVDNVKLTKTEQVEKALGTEIVSQIKDANIDTSTKREVTNKLIEQLDISEESKQVLFRKTENVINTTHGILTEDSAISQFEKKFNVKLDTSQQYHKRKINSKQYDWFIGGKVDGLYLDESPDKSYVVEVKNRTKGFFSSLREYEKVQIQLYIWMLDLTQARLVEQYKGKIRISVVYRDDDFIEDILESLEIFAKNIEEKFLNNYQIKRDYLNKNDSQKKVFINKLYLSEITQYLNMKFEKKVIDKGTSEDCLLDDLD